MNYRIPPRLFHLFGVSDVLWYDMIGNPLEFTSKPLRTFSLTQGLLNGFWCYPLFGVPLNVICLNETIEGRFIVFLLHLRGEVFFTYTCYTRFRYATNIFFTSIVSPICSILLTRSNLPSFVSVSVRFSCDLPLCKKESFDISSSDSYSVKCTHMRIIV